MKFRLAETRIYCLILCFGMALISGCGPSGIGATISGTVTVDGNLVEKGSIGFIPVDGSGPSSGAPIKDGTYSADVWPGKSKVEIRVPKVAGSEKMDAGMSDGPARPVMVEALPARYNSRTELELDISAGQNDKDWELSTQDQ